MSVATALRKFLSWDTTRMVDCQVWRRQREGDPREPERHRAAARGLVHHAAREAVPVPWLLSPAWGRSPCTAQEPWPRLALPRTAPYLQVVLQPQNGPHVQHVGGL